MIFASSPRPQIFCVERVNEPKVLWCQTFSDLSGVVWCIASAPLRTRVPTLAFLFSPLVVVVVVVIVVVVAVVVVVAAPFPAKRTPDNFYLVLRVTAGRFSTEVLVLRW